MGLIWSWMFLINHTFKHFINDPVITTARAGWSRRLLKRGGRADPLGPSKMFDGLKYHPDAFQNALLATSANTKVRVPR